MRFQRSTLLLALCCLLFAGCSALSLVYRNAGPLGSLWINRALDLPDAHREVVAEAAREVHRWHRAGPRLELAALLREAQRRLATEVSVEDGRWLVDQVQAHLSALGVELARRAGPRFPPLTAADRARIERRLASRRADYGDKIAIDNPLRQRARRIDRFEEAAAEWFGWVSTRQQVLIANSPAVTDFDARQWIGERERREQTLLSALAADDAGAALQAWFVDWRSGRPEAVARSLKRQREASIALWVAMANAASPEQRQYLLDRLGTWAEVFEDGGE